MLAGEMEGGPARDQDAEVRAGGEQGSQSRCRLDHVLEVVQQEEHMPVGAIGMHLLLQGEIAGLP